MVDLAYEWDGETPEATLHVDGDKLHGEPEAARRVWMRMVRMRDGAMTRERQLDELVAHARALVERVEEARRG